MGVFGNTFGDTFAGQQGTLLNYPKYGISWEEASDLSAVTRTFDAVGKTATAQIGTTGGASDFDTLYPWSEIKRCNINEGVITYEDEDGYEIDGTNGDVFVEIPKFCYERTIVAGVETRTISQGGLPVHPAFIENGVTLPKIYVSAFESSYDGEMKSISGVRPTENETASTFLTQAKAKGSRYSLYDFRTVDAIQNLMWIEFANRNSTAIFGNGWAALSQPVISAPSVLTEAGANRIVFGRAFSNNDQERFFVGANIIICQTTQNNIIAHRKIVSRTINSPAVGQTEVVFDGAPIDITTSHFCGNGAQDCGLTETMTYHTGRTNRARVIPASAIAMTKLNSNKYREIENLSGNVWHMLPDVTFSNLAVYVSKAMSDYEFFKKTGSYILQADLTLPEQNTNTDGKWVYSLTNGTDKNIAFGQTFGASDETKRFGGFYYLNTGESVLVNGGGFDHDLRCNIMTHRAQVVYNLKWFLYGCRMIYKPI